MPGNKEVRSEKLDSHDFIYFLIFMKIVETTDYGHPERAFFQKCETFGLGQTNWAEIS